MTGENGSNVVVVGIGAMGGGMARALLTSPNVKTVCGYDKSIDAVTKFYEESKQANKSLPSSPSSLYEAISAKTDFVIISLVNESQCQQVCFGGTSDEPDLLSIMSKGSCVIMTSTVTGTCEKYGDVWVKSFCFSLKPTTMFCCHFSFCSYLGKNGRSKVQIEGYFLS